MINIINLMINIINLMIIIICYFNFISNNFKCFNHSCFDKETTNFINIIENSTYVQQFCYYYFLNCFKN